MLRRITLAALIALAACAGGPLELGGTGALSYAQYHALEPGLRAQRILRAFGPADDTLERDGKIRGLTYRCEDARGEVRRLRMVFSADERLEEWVLSGQNGAS